MSCNMAEKSCFRGFVQACLGVRGRVDTSTHKTGNFQHHYDIGFCPGWLVMSLMVRERGRVGRLGVCIVLVGAGIRRLGTNEKNILDREKSEKAVLMRFESVFFLFLRFRLLVLPSGGAQ